MIKGIKGKFDPSTYYLCAKNRVLCFDLNQTNKLIFAFTILVRILILSNCDPRCRSILHSQIHWSIDHQAVVEPFAIILVFFIYISQYLSSLCTNFKHLDVTKNNQPCNVSSIQQYINQDLLNVTHHFLFLFFSFFHSMTTIFPSSSPTYLCSSIDLTFLYINITICYNISLRAILLSNQILFTK